LLRRLRRPEYEIPAEPFSIDEKRAFVLADTSEAPAIRRTDLYTSHFTSAFLTVRVHLVAV
jgi:hypothetical protein